MAADLVLLPSLYEGLPVAIVEAQAAGVACLIPDHVSPEVEVVPGLISRLPLASGARAWAARLRELLRDKPARSSGCLALVEASPFNLERGSDSLLSLYRSLLEHADRQR